MASGGAQIAWGVTRFLVGLVLWCVAGLFVFVLADGAMPLWAAITVSVLVMLGLPTLLTRLLIAAFAKLGERPRWIELWPGLCGVVALLALVGPPLFARSFSARKLAEVSVHHRAALPWIKRLTETFSGWLTPAPATPPVAHGHRDGGFDGDVSRLSDSAAASEGSVDAAIVEDRASGDASESDDVLDDEAAFGDGNAVDSVADDAAMESTGDAIALVAEDASAAVEDAHSNDDDDDDEQSAAAGTVAQQPPIDPNNSASGLSEFATLDFANSPRAVWMGELALGGADEVVVSHGDRVQVFYVQNDAIVERAVFAPRAAAGTNVMMARTLVADIDGDGHRDLGLCAYFTTERGGTRGGNVWWARARANGQFEAPRVLVGPAIDCAGIEFGDVNSDQRPELIVVRENNAYAPTPNLRDSELLWFTGQGTQWTQRGRVRLARGAQSVWLDDVTRDGILDVIVHTNWEESRNWVIAGARRGPSGVVNVEDVGEEERSFAQAQGRLDGDGRTDVVRIEQRSLRWYRTASDGRPARTSASRALDFERYEF
jgi:hypothetical protein